MAGMKVTLAKPVGGGDPNVTWLVIDPFQTTTVEWEENYWIYASATEYVANTVIKKMSEVTPGPAQDAGYYPLTSAAIFGGFQKDTSISAGTYSANNLMPKEQYPYLTFGLSQSAMIGQTLAERSPISAQIVPAQLQIQMTPFTSVYVWMQAQFASATIITKIIGNSTVANFGGGTFDIALKYDADKAAFVPDTTSEKKFDQKLIEVRMPLLI